MINNKKRPIYIWLIVIIMALLGLSFIYPFYYLFINSVKGMTEYYKTPFAWPSGEFDWNTYKTMLSNFKILKYFGHTLIVVLGTLIVVIPVSICTAFTFSKFKFRGSNFFYLLMVASMTIPAQVTAVPLYTIFGKLNLLNTYTGMIIANLSFMCGSTVMMSAFFKSIPNELLDAAKIDGCGYFQTIKNVVLPIGKPIIVVQVILTVNNIWNELFLSSIILQKSDVKTIMPALSDLIGQYIQQPTYSMAGMLLAAMPTLIVFILFQKQIVRGVLAGAVKG